MLNTSALDSLATRLANVLTSFDLPAMELGHPEVVRKASEQAAQVFQGYAKALPSKADSYAAALAFMREQRLDERQTDLVASALSERVHEQGKKRALGHRSFPSLLDGYSRDAQAGNLWRLTWFGLLGSYFSFDPGNAPPEEQVGWKALREFLERTWPLIDRQSSGAVVPDWMKVVRGDPLLLGERAAHKYALDYLRGDDKTVKSLSENLGIPESSWFWHALVLSAVKRSAEQGDDRFKASIPKLLALLQSRPVFRDEALEVLLARYHQCTQHPVDKALRDYVVGKDVWRNPKHRAAGLACAWNRVSEEVWRMVFQWVNESNLKDFFAVLAARRNAGNPGNPNGRRNLDERRLDFWSQYLGQITWTRLIFSSQTKALAYSNEAIRNLIAREEGSFATMSSNADVDAFMMQVGDYIIVEFSKVPNAAYVYKADELPFEPYEPEYAGTKADLKHGYSGERAARLTHEPGWEDDAGLMLENLGIYPDVVGSASRPGVRQPPAAGERAAVQAPASSGGNAGGGARSSAPAGAPFTIDSLKRLVAQYPQAKIEDGRSKTGGRLRVSDPMEHSNLERRLKDLGFRPSKAKAGNFYYPVT